MLENLEQLDKKYVINTYARNYTEFVKGKNAVLIDSNGVDYIDFTSGIGVVSVGHGNKTLSDAITLSASSLIHTSNLYVIKPQAKLAKELHKLSGFDMQSFFANSGAEANEGAIKIARKYGEVDGEIKRYKIITLEKSFHGRTISALKATGQESMHNYFGPFPDGFSYAPTLDDIKNMIDNHTIAVMIELVQGEGGVESLDKIKVQALAKLLKEKNILLIIDEVQTGVYRTGKFLASNLYEIEPDIITLAKGLGGGVPIGAVMTRHKSVLGLGDHGSTFGGNFLSSSASLSVLDILNKEYNSGSLELRISYFTKKIDAIFTNHRNFFIQNVGFGLMRGLRVKDADTLNKIVQIAHKKRVLVLKAGRNTLRFLPPLTITTKEIDDGFARLEDAINSI
jgi:acetylornithine aminotransferase